MPWGAGSDIAKLMTRSGSLHLNLYDLQQGIPIVSSLPTR